MLRIMLNTMVNFTTKKTHDYVIATGKTYSVKYFINKAAKYLNLKIKNGKAKVSIRMAYDEKEIV